ncbi:MAG TPA: hypothetical protein VNL18_03515 [Gemmatimonadales bacterium]|nr:hypothetical protein [Gemmatimonadales bacterium]
MARFTLIPRLVVALIAATLLIGPSSESLIAEDEELPKYYGWPLYGSGGKLIAVLCEGSCSKGDLCCLVVPHNPDPGPIIPE